MSEPSSNNSFLIAFVQKNQAVCPRCQYNLRQLSSNKCPECGISLQLTVGATEPYLRPWLSLLVPASLAGGLGIFLLIAIMAYGWEYEILIPALSSWLCLPIATIALIWRRRFTKLSTRKQWVYTSLTFAIAVIAFVSTIAIM